MSKKVSTIKDLRDSLLDAYNDLCGGKLDNRKAREIARMSNEIIKTAAIQLDYKKAIGSDSEIEFLK